MALTLFEFQEQIIVNFLVEVLQFEKTREVGKWFFRWVIYKINSIFET